MNFKYLPPPKNKVGILHFNTCFTQCSKVSKVKLVFPMGSPVNPSAPHCITIEFGWNEVNTLWGT